MKKSFIVICVVLLFKSIAAQSDMSVDTLACNSPEAHLFDFWIGDWDIQQKIIRKDGTWLELKAQTSVAPILNGCALEEHWSGNVEFFWDGMQSVKYMEGFSIRYYDHRKGKWNIRWLDNNNLFMGSGSEGNFNNGKGEFFSESTTPNGKQISRITFSNIKENSVDWDLAISNDEGKTWIKVWIMEMKRRRN